MEANKILDADVLDIIFEGRNKSYGAYQLRKTYNTRMVKALTITGSLLLLVSLSALAYNLFSKHEGDERIAVHDTEIAHVKKDDPIPPTPPAVVPPPQKEIKQITFTPPKIVDDNEVKPDEKIEDIPDDAAISTKTVITDNTSQIVQAPVEDRGSQVVALPVKATDENEIFSKVEIEAGYPGGNKAFSGFLLKNLSQQLPADENLAPGTYTVIIRFVVSKDGSLSDLRPETNLGHGLEEEAMRVLRKSIKWTPAQQNGSIVNAYRRQPITWVVPEE